MTANNLFIRLSLLPSVKIRTPYKMPKYLSPPLLHDVDGLFAAHDTMPDRNRTDASGQKLRQGMNVFVRCPGAWTGSRTNHRL